MDAYILAIFTVLGSEGTGQNTVSMQGTSSYKNCHAAGKLIVGTYNEHRSRFDSKMYYVCTRS